jgi:hypothetical protein
MKQKFLIYTLVASTVLVAAIGISIAQSNKNALSELALSNIEALADDPPPIDIEEDGSTDGEGGGGVGITCGQYTGRCWTTAFVICFKGEGTFDRCLFEGSANAYCANRCAGY